MRRSPRRSPPAARRSPRGPLARLQHLRERRESAPSPRLGRVLQRLRLVEGGARHLDPPLHRVEGVVRPRHVEDDLLVRRVEAEVRRGQGFPGRVDRGLLAAEVEQQPLERERRQKELRVGDEEPVGVEDGLGERKRHALDGRDGLGGEHRGVHALRDPHPERRFARPLPRDARLGVGPLGDVDQLGELVGLARIDRRRAGGVLPGRPGRRRMSRRDRGIGGGVRYGPGPVRGGRDYGVAIGCAPAQHGAGCERGGERESGAGAGAHSASAAR